MSAIADKPPDACTRRCSMMCCQDLPSRNWPHFSILNTFSIWRLQWGGKPTSYRVRIWYGKTRMARLQSDEGCMMIDLVDWAQYINVTDTPTHCVGRGKKSTNRQFFSVPSLLPRTRCFRFSACPCYYYSSQCLPCMWLCAICIIYTCASRGLPIYRRRGIGLHIESGRAVFASVCAYLRLWLAGEAEALTGARCTNGWSMDRSINSAIITDKRILLSLLVAILFRMERSIWSKVLHWHLERSTGSVGFGSLHMAQCSCYRRLARRGLTGVVTEVDLRLSFAN